MEIAKELAESIVKEMKKVIEKDLNFINSEGIIVASTDKKG
ncbi:sugar diacid recognition domain-containing protein [Fusobacterium sp.]|nr:sugar diacid recognition domain-containing protein [Fusobacterium sp.]